MTKTLIIFCHSAMKYDGSCHSNLDCVAMANSMACNGLLVGVSALETNLTRRQLKFSMKVP